MREIWLAIGVMAIVTVFTRAAPFLFFMHREPPRIVHFLGEYLPPVVMTVLVLNCVKDIDFTKTPYGLKELGAMAFTAVMHLWKRNALLSIFGGTILYMVLVQAF